MFNIDIFEENGKFGIAEYNSDGSLLGIKVKPQYDRIYDLMYDAQNNGTAIAQSGDKFFLINLDGRPISEEYDEMKHFESGMCGVKTGGTWGYIDETGKVIIPPRYENAGSFLDGTAIVEFEGKKWIINEKGEFLTDQGYDSILPLDEDKHRFIVTYDGNEKTITIRI